MNQTAPAKPKKGLLSKQARETLIAYSFIAPNFIGFAVFTLIPVVYAFVLAFMQWDGVNEMKFVWFENFARLISDKNFIQAFWHTIAYVLCNVPLTIVCSLALALLLNSKIFGRNFFRTVSFFPYVASLVAVAAVWNFLFNPSMGPVNQILAALGVENLPKHGLLYGDLSCGPAGCEPGAVRGGQSGRRKQMATVSQCYVAADLAHHVLCHDYGCHLVVQGV